MTRWEYPEAVASLRATREGEVGRETGSATKGEEVEGGGRVESAGR